MFTYVSTRRGFPVLQGRRLTACEPTQRNSHSTDRRRGVILVLSAVFMVVILSFTALTVDLAYISLTKTQLQAAADGAALGAGIEMGYGFGENAETASTVLKKGTEAAQAVAAVHKNGDLDSTYLDASGGIRFGTLTWDKVSESWQETWGASPYNLVQVRINRGRNFSHDALSNSGGDGPLPLLFGPIIGNSTMSVTVTSTAALLPAVGIRVPRGGRGPMLPIAVDLESWDDLMLRGIGSDKYSVDTETNSVSKGPDGILELNIYPEKNSDLPSGNRGTVNFGNPSNSTSDLERQIVEGLNADDMSYFPNNEISLEGGSFDVSGDTGISVGIKDELASIIGQPRIVPLFTNVSGRGTNATYTIVRWVGARVVAVKLTGKHKYVYVQPVSFVAPGTIRATEGGPLTEIRDDTIFAPLFLYK